MGDGPWAQAPCSGVRIEISKTQSVRLSGDLDPSTLYEVATIAAKDLGGKCKRGVGTSGSVGGRQEAVRRPRDDERRRRTWIAAGQTGGQASNGCAVCTGRGCPMMAGDRLIRWSTAGAVVAVASYNMRTLWYAGTAKMDGRRYCSPSR